MHIIIDIRDAHPFSSITERYGESWWNLWKSHHPHDTITYLIFESQKAKTERYIQVPRWPASWWRKKKLMSHTWNEVFRCVNFSLYEPYNKHIPTLTHIFHNRAWLYPNEWENTYIARKGIEYRMHGIIEKSSKIIVPSMSTWLECVELWWIGEHDIEIIPYIPLIPWEVDILTPMQFQIHSPFFLYDGEFWSESNIIGMLKWFEMYKHVYGWKNILIMHGSPGYELSNITQMIRAFDLTEHVKLVGILEWSNREWLYQHASAWLMVGSYFSGWPLIELAHAHGLPMVLSEISPLKSYESIHLHPNHIGEELAPILINIEKHQGPHTRKPHSHMDTDIMRAYEIYLSGSHH